MKPLVFSFTLLTGIVSASAQSYSIDWFKVAGGGGSSTGGVYSVSGTIGSFQPSGRAAAGSRQVSRVITAMWIAFSTTIHAGPFLPTESYRQAAGELAEPCFQTIPDPQDVPAE